MENNVRLIDANALEEYIADNYGYPAVDILHEIATFPAVDAVPVVRCKDCKHSRVATWGERYCARKGIEGLDEMSETDFCSYGERKENGIS